MYKFIFNLFSPSILPCYNKRQLLDKALIPVVPTYLQSRSTYILKRRYPTKLYKKGRDFIRLKGKDYIYDLVENTDISKKPDVKVILKKYVEATHPGLGQRGDVVTVKRNFAYNNLLVPGIGDYATPEAIEKANSTKENATSKDTECCSTLTAMQTVQFLEKQVLSVVMNKEMKWILQPWHIRVSFRKAGIHVPDECILLPKSDISGPDLRLEEKEFFINVVINNKERASVRCKIHHWSTNPGDRLPQTKNYWAQKNDPIFPEDAEKLEKFTIHPSIIINNEQLNV